MTCPLCELVKDFPGQFVIVECDTCHIPMIVSKYHRPEFSDVEKQVIRVAHKGKKIRWEMRKIKDHAHAHLLED